MYFGLIGSTRANDYDIEIFSRHTEASDEW